MPASRQPATDAEPKSAADWHERGNALIEEGRIDRAISAYRKALRLDDGRAEAHNDLGTAYFEKRWLEQAEQCFRKAIALKPDHGVAHANLGATLRAQGRLTEGRRAFQRALLLRVRAALPPFLRWRVGVPGAQPSAAVVAALEPVRRALAGQDLAAAKALALAAEKRFAREAEVLHLLAAVLDRLGETREALPKAQAAARLAPERAAFRRTLAKVHLRLGSLPAALEAALEALRLEPASAAGYALVSAAHREAGRLELAEQAARRAVELDAELAAGHDDLALALWRQERMAEAIESARAAVRLAPDETAYRMNLAVMLRDAGKLEEATLLYRELRALASPHGDIQLNLGSLALNCEADLAAARAHYRKAAEADGRASAVLSEAVVDLLEGNLAAGWRRFEARKQVPGQRERHDLFARIPAWTGQPLEDQRLLVYGEQGVGDEIQFASLLPEVARRVRHVSLLCDPRLAALLARSFPGIAVIPAPPAWRLPDLRRFDLALGSASLPMYFRGSAADFPSHKGYLAPDPAAVASWHQRLAAAGDGPRIGISWRGGILRSGREQRSLPLEALPALLARRAVWVSLQHGERDGERERVEAMTGAVLHRFEGVTHDLDELAGLVSALDLVVTVCNTTVHVAGALGKEALVLVPRVPLPLYGLTGERMLWYPSVRLFRQGAIGQWSDVVDGVAAALDERLATLRAAR